MIGKEEFSPSRLTFENEVFSVFKNGTLVTQAPATEIMGGPLHSLRWLVSSLTQRGMTLPQGSLVIPGSPVELIEIDEDLELGVEIEGVGKVRTPFCSAAE